MNRCMNEYDLVVHDDNCRELAQEYVTQAERYEEILEQYTDIIQNILETGIKEGNVHDNLQVYLNVVMTLKQQVTQIAGEGKKHTEDFLRDMDTADSYIY